MHKLDIVLLKCAAALVGRFATYELTGKCLLPAGYQYYHNAQSRKGVLYSRSNPAIARIVAGRRVARASASEQYAEQLSAALLCEEPVVTDPLIYMRLKDGRRELTAALIAFAGIPNHSMKPINIPAKIIHKLFRRGAGESINIVSDGSPPPDAERNAAKAAAFAEKRKAFKGVLYDHEKGHGLRAAG